MLIFSALNLLPRMACMQNLQEQNSVTNFSCSLNNYEANILRNYFAYSPLLLVNKTLANPVELPDNSDILFYGEFN